VSSARGRGRLWRRSEELQAAEEAAEAACQRDAVEVVQIAMDPLMQLASVIIVDGAHMRHLRTHLLG